MTKNEAVATPSPDLSPEEEYRQAQEQFSQYFQTHGEDTMANGLDRAPSPTNMFLRTLLWAMQAKFRIDKKYQKNIKDFSATYVFNDKSEKIHQAVTFSGGRMHVDSELPADPTFTLTFKDGKSLLKLLFSPAPDVLNALLNQEVDFRGNLNYLNKFAYMAMQAKPHL